LQTKFGPKLTAVDAGVVVVVPAAVVVGVVPPPPVDELSLLLMNAKATDPYSVP